MSRFSGVAIFAGICLLVGQPRESFASGANATEKAKKSVSVVAMAESFPANIQQILELPEQQIDTGYAALVFAKEIYPELDVVAYSSRLNQLVAAARKEIARYGKDDPDSVIRVLNSYYHFTSKAAYDFSPGGRDNRANYFINGIMDTKKGQCVTMPMLYMAIAQRLGYPVYAVEAPEHTFLRFVDPSLSVNIQNIEVSGRQIGSPTNAQYVHDFNISERGIKSGAYLRTLTRRQWLGILLLENGLVFAKEGRVDRAILYFEKAAELDPQDPYYFMNLQRNTESNRSGPTQAHCATRIARYLCRHLIAPTIWGGCMTRTLGPRQINWRRTGNE